MTNNNIVHDIVMSTTYKKCKNILNNNDIFISNVASSLIFLFPSYCNINKYTNQGGISNVHTLYTF